MEKLIACKNIGCRKTFRWRVQRSRHERGCTYPAPESKVSKYQKDENDMWQCTQCSKTFKHQSGVIKHGNKGKCSVIHAPSYFTCNMCSASFVFECRLIQHKKKHAPEVQKVCTTCDRKFKRKDHFEIHIKHCNSILENITGSFLADLTNVINVLDNSNTGLLTPSSPNRNTIPPSSNDKQPATAATEPATNATEPVTDATEQATDAIESVTDATEPATDATEPATDATEPATDAAEPGTDATEPATDATEPATDATEPATDATEPVTDATEPASQRQYWKDYKYRKRKSERLEQIITSMKSPARKKVLSDVVKRAPLDEILTYTASKDTHEAKVVESVINRLKTLNAEKKYSAFYQLINTFFCNEMEDVSFRKWLCSKIGIRQHRFGENFVQWKERDFHDSRGRCKLKPEVVQQVFDLWVENSVTTTVGSNGRNIVRIGKKRVLEAYGNILENENVNYTLLQNKRGKTMITTNRRVATCTVRELQSKLKNLDLDLSLGTVVALKPFFITYPTDKDYSLCLCKLCLNAHLLLKPLMVQAKQDGDELTDSVTQFFTHNVKCDKSTNGYFHWRCVTGQCNNCKDNRTWPLRCSTSQAMVKSSQFKLTECEYTSDNKSKTAKKTVRVEQTKTYQETYKQLGSMKTTYLMHKFQVYNDTYHWPKILNTVEIGSIYHMDYSENIAQMYKDEPQSSHFNKEQFSLHCTVKHSQSGNEYLYHLSDDKKHDFAFTSNVVRDFCKSNIESDTIIRVKSDNCSAQYKCRCIFEFYRDFSAEQRQTVIVYYGAAGHGKGLVDAMSAFGVKTPLKREVVETDFFFSTANDILSFLTMHFDGDTKKHFFVIEKEGNEELRKQQKAGFPIKNSSKQHMLSFFQDGKIQAKINMCSCDYCLKGDFVHCGIERGTIISNADECDSDNTSGSDDDVTIEDQAESFQIRGDCVLNAIEKKSIIALYSPEKSFEPFYLCQVNDFGIATQNLVDKNNHVILSGEQFIECQYLDKRSQGKSRVKYTLLPDIIYVNPAMVASPVVNMMSDMSMSIDEYIWLSDTI